MRIQPYDEVDQGIYQRYNLLPPEDKFQVLQFLREGFDLGKYIKGTRPPPGGGPMIIPVGFERPNETLGEQAQMQLQILLVSASEQVLPFVRGLPLIQSYDRGKARKDKTKTMGWLYDQAFGPEEQRSTDPKLLAYWYFINGYYYFHLFTGTAIEEFDLRALETFN